MNGNAGKINRVTRTDQNPESNGVRFPLILAVGAVVILLGYLVFRPSKSSTEAAVSGEPVARSPVTVSIPKRHVGTPVVREAREISPGTTHYSPTPAAQPSEPTQAPQFAGSLAVAQGLVTRLAQPEFFSGGITPEKAEELKRSLKELADQGVAAVPAIREYLERFQDIDFDAAGAGKLVGYSSLRMGMLDALGQIGGPEAMELSLQMLQKTGDPLEIGFLAKVLDKHLPPEQFRQAALSAASDALAQVSSSKPDGRSVAPLFEVLQKYGDESVVGMLEQAVGRWKYSATLVLAGMPDGAGIPALIRLAQDPAIRGAGTGDYALRPLAQAAMQYPEARTALVDQARLNQIPESAWPTVAASLTGNYIQYGTQIFSSTTPKVLWNSEQVGMRIAIIDQLLAVTPNGAGQQALQNARVALVNRLPK
jgi:hypothetical protein